MKFLDSILKSPAFLNFDIVLKQNKLSHAYLIVGDNDDYNAEFSLVLALKLECQNKTACKECVSCKKILNGFHPDVFVFPKNKSFVVADSKEIIDNVAVKPLESDFKIFIINKIENATIQSQNKLLKTVEEAPKNVIFIFNTSNPSGVLNTIKSRTQEINISSSENQSFNNSVSYLFVLDMLNNMKSSRQILNFVNKFAEKSSFLENINALYEIFGQLLQAKSSSNHKLSNLAEEFELNAITEILAIIITAKRQFDANVNPNIIADNLLLKILEVKYKWKTKR